MRLCGLTTSCASDPGLGRRLGMLTLVGALLTAAGILAPVRVGVVSGHSMEPTLRYGQPFFYEPATSGLPVRAGEIVLVRLGDQVCVKRVFARGGARFWTMGRTADRQGHQIVGADVPISRWKARYPRLHFRQVRVPRGRLFLLGDGTTSMDSRHFGPVPASCVIGRVVLPARVDPPAHRTMEWVEPRPRQRRAEAARRRASG